MKKSCFLSFSGYLPVSVVPRTPAHVLLLAQESNWACQEHQKKKKKKGPEAQQAVPRDLLTSGYLFDI